MFDVNSATGFFYWAWPGHNIFSNFTFNVCLGGRTRKSFDTVEAEVFPNRVF
jgi:hypothetical protein